MSTAFFILAIVGVVGGVVSSAMIIAFLSRRGIKINYLFLRIYIYRYVSQYRQITTEENGKAGPLFYSLILSFGAALLFAVVGVIFEFAV